MEKQLPQTKAEEKAISILMEELILANKDNPSITTQLIQYLKDWENGGLNHPSHLTYSELAELITTAFRENN